MEIPISLKGAGLREDRTLQASRQLAAVAFRLPAEETSGLGGRAASRFTALVAGASGGAQGNLERR